MYGERAKFAGWKTISQASRIVPGASWRDPFFHLFREIEFFRSLFSRLRARGLLTAKEMSERFDVTFTTINAWGRKGLLRKYNYDNDRRCLYEPLDATLLTKGHGGRGAKQPVFIVERAG